MKKTKKDIQDYQQNESPDPCMKEDLTREELEVAIRKLKTKKAPDDMLKQLGAHSKEDPAGDL